MDRLRRLSWHDADHLRDMDVIAIAVLQQHRIAQPAHHRVQRQRRAGRQRAITAPVRVV